MRLLYSISHTMRKEFLIVSNSRPRRNEYEQTF